MSFFSVGNLLTLGIVALALILFRQLDKNNRSLDKLRKYGERLKEDLTDFVIQKEAAVRDYGVALDVHQKAAKELMNRLQISDDDLAAKTEAVANLNEKIKTYDATLGELVRMTVRVQENLNRIQDESSFVEGVGKRVIEAKEKLTAMEKGLTDLELRFERENADSLEQASASMIGAVKSTVLDLQATAETIERQVEDHREAINKVEQDRAANIARDMAAVEKTLKEAVEQAGLRADKMEEAALVKLREQAMERVQRFQTVVEEKLRVYQESSKAYLTDIQGVAKNIKEEWKTDHAEIAREQRAFKEDWKNDIQDIETQLRTLNDMEVDSAGKAAELEGRLKDLDGRTTDAVGQMQQRLSKTIEEEGQKALEAADAKLDEYRTAQAREFERLGSLSDDTAKLDGELRRYMQETENRVRQDFSLFEQNFANTRNAASAEFAADLDALRGDVSAVERELARLKEQAYETVSDKLKVFEEDFSADLFRRREEFDARLGRWKDTLDTELTALADESREERRKLESAFSDDLKRRFADEDARLVSELEHLKAEAGAFEEGIRNQMVQADESLDALKDQLDHNLSDARDTAESAVKAELGRFSISMADTLKQQQREIDGELKQISSQVESRSGEFGELLDESRRHIEEWQNKFGSQMRELDTSVDEYRRKIRDLGSVIENLREETAAQRTEAFAHTDEQAKILDSAIKDADRRIKEFLAQTKLFDQAEELKSSLERKIEDFRGDLNGLDQRRAEAAELEAKFVRIKRLEEEVDAKMVAFQSEKRRIELMETDFNRLLQTSQSVKEKLTEVSSSDDTLQAVQVQIRRLEDSLTDAEERYQRIEKKNQTLEETNAGIDDNFKALQEAEKAVQKVHGEMQRLLDEQEELRGSVEKLSAENAKVREASEKVSSLDTLLSSVEQRMDKLQTVRESLAKAETRFEEINKSVHAQFKAFTSLLKDEPGKLKGAAPIGTRETVIKLKQQGWAVEEIARTVKLSVGEVELILEMGSKI
ncbi:SpiroCoCo family coiled-coil protein [Treponema primitia]|uniref:SpiroCoCo family coiled-coil protein n=1 Tax=Treponema primitia TaxID=88058 RepID=UPI0002555248|nr:hypothetical protein [Treponema primitia]